MLTLLEAPVPWALTFWQIPSLSTVHCPVFKYCLHCVCMPGCFSRDRLLVALWTVAYQAPLSSGILQARIQGWVAVPFSRGSSQPRDGIQISCIAGGVFTIWATREAPLVVLVIIYCNAKLSCPLCNSNSESLLPFTMQHDTSWTKLLCLLLLSNTSSYWTLRLEYLPSLLFSWYLLKALFYVTVVLLKCGPWPAASASSMSFSEKQYFWAHPYSV